jgi:hypothetical protein|tara:strand:- start:3962 stop:4261 length:300 start_codon:yes stop_codon:yes gene_type:complete
MEIYGLIIFLGGAFYTAHQLHKDRVALNSDRRSVWKQQSELVKLREEETTKRMEVDQGFDWKSNLPMILSFLGGKGIDTKDLNMDEIQNLLTTMEDPKQ